MHPHGASQPPQLVFVVGFARSGTTLLATILDRHSRIAATPETHFFDEVVSRRVGAGDVVNSDRAVTTFLASDRVRDLGLTRDDFAALLEAKSCTWRDVFGRAMRVYASRHGADIVAEKTPAHLTQVGRMLEWFPDARVVHIVRDGRDAVLSLMRAPWTHSNLRRHARAWRWCMARMAAFRRAHPDRVFEVRYEALLERPRETVGAVDAFIGVEFEPAQLGPAAAPRTVPAWESGWKSKAADDLDPSRIAAWTREAAPGQRWTMNSMMGAALRANGYVDTGIDDCPAGVWVTNAALNAVFLAAYHPALKPGFVAVKRALRLFGVPTDRIDRPGRSEE